MDTDSSNNLVTDSTNVGEARSDDNLKTPECSSTTPCLSSVLCPKAWFDPSKLHPTVSELVYWRDPKKSGVVFGGIFLVLIALTWLSFISVVAYTSLAILSGTFAFRVYKNVVQTVQKTNEGHPFKEYLEQDLTLENDKTQEIYNAVISHINKLAIQLRHLFLVEDLVDSAKFGGVLYLLTYLGSWFNGLTLLILAFLALFGLPKVYEMNKRVIDQYMDLACAKVSEISAKVHEVLPFGKKEKAQ